MPARPLALGLSGPNRVAMGRVRRMVAALRRIGGSLWMVENAFSGSYIDISGSQPVTAYADLLGLGTDRLGVLGPNLFTGTYALGASTTATYSGGEATATFGGALLASANNWLSIPGNTALGTFSVIEYWATYVSGGSLEVGSTWQVGDTITAASNGGVRKRYTTEVRTGYAGIGWGPASFGATSAGSVWKVEVISVRELTGNHATQSAVASKPSVQRVPKRTRGATNLLLWSGYFSNAAWTKAGATVVTGQADPFGGTAASKLVESATNSAHYFLQSVVSGTGTATSAWVVKPAGRTKIQIRSESPQTGMLATMFNLATGAIQNGTGSIVALDNGFFLCVATAPSNGTGANGYHLMQTLNDSWQETYTGDGTSGVIVYRAALFTGTLTAQQILDNGGIPLTTTTALPNVLEWANVISFADNDFLQTGITTGNEGFVAAGVTFTDSNSTVACSGAGSNGQKGVWLYRTASDDRLNMLVGDGVLISATGALSTVTAGTPTVVSGGWTPTTQMLSVDNTETSSTRTNGNASPSPQTLRIGAYHDGTTYAANGSMHAIVYSAVFPDAATRKVIYDGLAALQGRTL